MPVEQSGDVRHEPALVLREHGGRLAQPDWPRPVGGRRRLRAAAPRQPGGDQPRRALAARLGRVDVDREQRAAGVQAEQEHVALARRRAGRRRGPRRAERVCERQHREPVAVHDHARVAREQRAGARVRALLRDPGRIAAPGVPARSSRAPVKALGALTRGPG